MTRLEVLITYQILAHESSKRKGHRKYKEIQDSKIGTEVKVYIFNY